MRLLVLILLLPFSAISAADPVWVPGWRTAAPLTTARAGAAVLEANGNIYALGGVDGRNFLQTVEYAPIRPDGTLGPWHLTAPLNEARGFFDAVAYNGYLYAAGGGNGPNGEHLLASVERAPLRSDGRLGPWERLPAALNLPRRCVKLATVGDKLYALGGFGGALLDSVERAGFTAGGLGPFAVEAGHLTLPRYVNAVKAHGDTLYVLGGHDESGGRGIAAVEYASVGADGAAQGWRTAAAMGAGRYGLAALSHGDRLYALGGLDGARYTDSIEVSRILPDRSLAPWRATTPLSSPRANFGALEHGGRIYIVGGTNRDGYYRTVEYAEIDPQGDLGYRGTPEEAAATAQLRDTRKKQTQAAQLPNEGEVREILHTEAYSYIRAADENGEQWIASPRVDCPVNGRIRYSRGTEMVGFYSRALARRFESVLFVEGMECVE
jgi:hypothetical protein